MPTNRNNLEEWDEWDEFVNWVPRPPIEWNIVDPNDDWGIFPPDPPFREKTEYSKLPRGLLGYPEKGTIIQQREIHEYGSIKRINYYDSGWIEEHTIYGTAAKVNCGCTCEGCKLHHRYEPIIGYREGIWVDGVWYPR
jgi:hypothetical protein